MAKKIHISMKCPFCNETVYYWKNCCASTNPDFGNVEFVQTKRGTKQYFHRSCYMKHVEEQRRLRCQIDQSNGY